MLLREPRRLAAVGIDCRSQDCRTRATACNFCVPRRGQAMCLGGPSRTCSLLALKCILPSPGQIASVAVAKLTTSCFGDKWPCHSPSGA